MTSNIRATLAFIDDDERVLRAMQLLFRDTYTVFITTNPEAYLNYIRFNIVHVAVSDQRMPLRQGVEILREVKDISPFTMRILLTGYADLEAIVGSINEGEIFRYLTKPCKAEKIRTAVNQAVDIAQANFSHYRTTASVPIPVDNDHLDMIVSMVNGINDPTSPTVVTTEESSIQQPRLKTTSPTTLPIISQILPTEEPENLNKLLLIDDCLDTKIKVEQQAEGAYQVLYASTLEQAYEHLAHHNIGVCLTDLMINNDSIAPIIYTLKQNNPSLVVLVQTEFHDTSALIELINRGQIFRCLPKPIRGSMLAVSITRAFEYHHKLRENSILAQRHKVKVSKTEEKDISASPKIRSLVGLFRQKFN